MEKQRKAREVDVELILLISWVLVGSMLIGWRIYSKRKRKSSPKQIPLFRILYKIGTKHASAATLARSEFCTKAKFPLHDGLFRKTRHHTPMTYLG